MPKSLASQFAKLYQRFGKSIALRGCLLVAFSFAVGVFFQNCGKAGFESGEMSDESIASSGDGSLGQGSPIAFDASIDQISYNSCAWSGVANHPAYYTVMFGAYESQGVTYNPDFVSFAKSKLKPIYPASTVSMLQVKEFIPATSENKIVTPQVSFRARSSPKDIRTANGNQPNLGIDFINLLGNLSDFRYVNPIFDSANRINYFGLGANGQRRMEGRISYNNSETLAKALRDDIEANGMLALLFSGSDADTKSIKGLDPGDSRVAIGRGFYMDFAQEKSLHSGNRYGFNPPHVLNPNSFLYGITEVDLRKPNNAGFGWSCTPDKKFLIFRKADAALCPPDDYFNRIQDQEYRKKLEMVRRHLKAEFWDVSIDSLCAVPKSTVPDCYPNENLPIQYDQSLACFYEGGSYNGDLPKERCAHVVSICTRN